MLLLWDLLSAAPGAPCPRLHLPGGRPREPHTPGRRKGRQEVLSSLGGTFESPFPCQRPPAQSAVVQDSGQRWAPTRPGGVSWQNCGHHSSVAILGGQLGLKGLTQGALRIGQRPEPGAESSHCNPDHT